MRFLSLKRLVFLILLVVVAGGVYLKVNTGAGDTRADEPKSKAKGGSSKGAAGKGGLAVSVQVATVEQKSVPVRIDAIGNVEPYLSVQLKPRIDGQIVEVNFKEGQEVRKGEVLFRIDPRPYEAVMKQAQANAARDRAQAERARSQDTRYKELLSKNFISADGYAQIQTNAQSADAVALASEAAVENAKVQLDYTTIRSPIDGYVGRVLLQQGNIARAADPNAIALINQVRPIYVTFAVPEKHLSDIRTRMKSGRLVVDAVPSDSSRTISGQLAFIDNAVDQTTGTIKLRAQFANVDNVLWPGQFANVSVRLYDESDALVLPSRAVQNGPEGQFVFVVKDDMTVEVRPVTIARNEGELAIAAKGVQKGERVVTQGQLRLAPGSRVSIAAGPVPSDP
jgi:multidrug efflux system membrane fusion protein